MKRAILLTLFFSAFSVLAACDVLPFSDNEPDPCNEGGTLFSDDFEGDQECGWVLYNRGGATTSIEDGVLKISTSSPGEIWWTNPARNFNDVIIDVNASQISGTSDNAYGVLCRYQDEENFYLFLISGDGYYVIGKYKSGEDRVIYLTEDGQYVPSEHINQDQATNNIQASCVGNELSLSVNGVPLLTVTDPDFSTGDIGLAVSTLQQGTIEIEFDDLQVFGP